MTKQVEELTFEDLFDSIIKESQRFLIEYNHKISHYKDDSFIIFNIISVNGCLTEYQFKKRLQGLIRDSLKNLSIHIQSIPKNERIDFLDNIKDELDELTYVVQDDTQKFGESEHGPREVYSFKTFAKPLFKGTQDDKIKFYETSIKRKAEKYADLWLQMIGEAKHKVDFLINQIDLLHDFDDGKEIINTTYVDHSRIIELKKIQSKDFDLTRLIQQCEELNDASLRGNPYSVILLVRAIIDHVPPIFGKKNFQEVANNYGAKSFKESMDRLDNSSRKIADIGLHQQIRKKETLPNKTQVNFSNDLDVLLAEIVRILK
ncbi:MAG: hypothetical protein WC599_00760 [Bacteroidales bacterium]